MYVYRLRVNGRVRTYEVGENDSPRTSPGEWCDRRVCEGFWGDEDLCIRTVGAMNNRSGSPIDQMASPERVKTFACPICNKHVGECGCRMGDIFNRFREDLEVEQAKVAQSERGLRAAVNAHCTCGGSGPGESDCTACSIWHEAGFAELWGKL